MTLILGLANQQQVILISDRRLSANGKIVEDESNKAATFNLQDARLAVAFTGLARMDNFQTRRWLLAALLDSANPDYQMEPTIKRFCNHATQDFAKIAVPRKLDKRLTVVLAGYCYNEMPPRCYYWLISNFEGFDSCGSEPLNEFRTHWYRDRRPSEESYSLIFTAGIHVPVSQTDADSLRTLLQENRPASALVGKGVEVLRAIAKSPLSKKLVGQQCTSIVLPSSPDVEGSLEYHSGTPRTKLFAPSIIEARGRHAAFVIDSPEVEIRDRSGRPLVLSVPKVGPNQSCRCGSGKKYKKCCGAIAKQGEHTSKTLRFGKG
jgi:SEC-C motif